MPCIVPDPRIKKLASNFPGETLASVTNMIGIWQEREIAKGNKNITVESIPTAATLRELYDSVRQSDDLKIKFPKEEFAAMLDGKELPKQLTSLAERLGIHIKVNRRDHTMELTTSGATRDDFRLFKALAVDVVYDGDIIAETAFQMTPRERLAAIIDWESANRRRYARNVDIMNYELQLAKRNLRDMHGISTDGIMEALRKQASEAFTSRERMERIAEITDLFDKILTERHEAKLQELAERRDQLNEWLENKDQQDFPNWEFAQEAYLQELGEIQEKLGSQTRLKTLQEVTPKAIFDEILDKYAHAASQSDNNDAFVEALLEEFRLPRNFVRKNLAWYKDQVQKVVDNFAVLRDESCRELESSEMVRINVTLDDSIDIEHETPHEEENTDGEDENDVNGIENQYKENWMYEYDTVSNFSKMSARVRHMLYKCPLGHRRTRFGSEYYVPVMQVVNTLIQEMQGVTNSRDMEAVLKNIQDDYPWVRYIREQIVGQPRLKTELFRSLRRYAQSLAILQKSTKRSEQGDMTKNKLMIINSGNTESTILTAAQNQISSGVPINKRLSIFEDESLDLQNVDKLLDIFDEYGKDDLDEIAGTEVEAAYDLLTTYPDLLSDLHTVLTALGFAVTEADIREVVARNLPKGSWGQKNNLAFLIANSRSILKKIKENGYKSIDDLLNEPQNLAFSKKVIDNYRYIARALTLADNGAVEASVRENGKVRYSYVLPSVLDDLITGLQGKMYSAEKSKARGKRSNKTTAEYIAEKYGDDPRFAHRGEDGIHYRNYILEALVNGNASAPNYITLLNVDTAKRDKTEQKDLTQQDRLNMVWAMYNMDEAPYENAKGTWFPIPLPSDSGRIGFISFVSGVDVHEIIKEAIIKELERMTDDSSDAHLPETYRKNKGKFCTFPVLNNPELNGGYDIADILDEFRMSQNTDQYANLDITLNDLVSAVMQSMVEKFKEENAAFYNARVKEVGAEAVEDFILNESIFQMAINELLNGDAAYYTGYNTGSDNEQKRAKQSIVPLDHIDIFNEDFLEAYKAYHGIDTDKKLDEEDIVERVLYIEDPKIPSPSFDDLKSLYDDALSDGIIDKETYNAFLKNSSSIKYTDGQSFRSFESMRMMMYALGEMEKGDDLDLALGRIAEGKQQAGDALIVRTALKPFLSGLVPIEDADGTTRLMPVQHKLSEQILTAALVQAQGTKLGSSPALKALARIMKDEHIDTIIFTSGVKVGQNGAVDFGDVDVEASSEDTIVKKIYDEMAKYRSLTGMDLVHQIPYSLYGIVAQNPDSELDGSDVPIGVQLQKLIAADLPDKITHRVFEGNNWVIKTEPALYPVEGVGNLTRDEIISLYNKLMTEKILRAYHEVTGTFADKNQLSEALMRFCRNSSRNSAYLERAFSLDEYGNFVIPLCDLATLNMSSEFLNSIVKNAVSRISAPGKQLVSMSAFGFANDLKIEFEYDKDGYPVRYKAIDCLLPAWSRHIIAKCTNDEGILDFSKLEKESPDLLRAIGVRIPTQFKNFILPLRCVGFLPTILGDTIVTAIDSVVLQDSDFDNDKVPTIFPSFEAQYYEDNWEESIRRDYNELFDSYYNYSKLKKDYDEFIVDYSANSKNLTQSGYGIYDFISDRREELGEDEFNKQYRMPDAPEGEPMPFWQYKQIHKEEFRRKDGPKLVYSRFNPAQPLESQSDGAINNGIINVMYGMLTGKSVSTMSLAVGSTEKFDPIIKLLRENSPQQTYPDGRADIATRVAQETRNNDGKQMIAVFANAEAMQAMLQHTTVGLANGVGVTINGRTLQSLHDVNIEDSIEYISRYIGTALGAAADNAKDPKLSVMNINLRTAPVVSLMLQLGYTMEEVALFLNIPSIRHYTDTGEFGDYEVPDASDLQQFLPGTTDDMLEAIRFGDNYRDMEDGMADYCNTALSVFVYLSQLGERMRMLSSLARGDSGGTAPHGPIENNLVRFLNYELFEEMEKENPMFDNWRDIVKYSYDQEASEREVETARNPLAQAYITYGVVGAFRELSEYYPGIGDPNFRKQIKDIIKKYYNGVATTTNVKNIMYALYNYIESSYDCMRKDDYTFEESRNYYLNYFPEEAAQLISAYPDIANSLLFRRLKLYSTLESDSPFISLQYDGTMLPETRDEFTAVWQQLFYARNEDGTPNTELRELALDLFKYCYFRNGFRFSDGTFAHLAPAEARLFFPGYAEMLEDMQDNPGVRDYSNFEQQYVRNNLYDRRFCQTVPSDVRKPDGWLVDGNPADTVTIKYRSKMSEANQKAYEWYFAGDDNRDKPRTAFLITKKQKDGSISYLYYIKVADNDVTGESTYALTTPLGWKDKAVEYSATEHGITMPSVFDQDEIAMSLRRKGKKKPKTKKFTDDARSTSTSSNSSEAPNEPQDDNTDFNEKYKGFYTYYFSGVGYKEAQELYPDTVKSKKFKDARASYLKAQKSGKIGNPKAKSKEQVKREKDGGRKSKVKVIESTSKSGTVISEEAKCAQEIGAYTVCITDNDSGQLAMGIHSATPNDAHFVEDAYQPGNAYDIANALRAKLARKKVKSVVLNLTGSYMNTIGRYATQEDLDSYVLGIYNAIKDKGIFVTKVVTTAQPGIPLASARAAMKLGYALEIHPTSDYKMYSEVGKGKPVADKDTFMKNISPKLESEDSRKEGRVYDKEDGPFITAKNKWTREIAAKDKKTIYVFTDNTDRTSGSNKISATTRYGKKYGGRRILSYPSTTSAVIRGLENAFPLSLQKNFSPGNTTAGQWQDSDLAEFRRVISDEINDIIEAFESGEYKRVVLPVGGVFDGPIADISKERTPKLYRELTKQMEYLADSINEIADTIVSDKKDEDDFVPGFKVDNNDTLAGDEIQPTSFADTDMSNSNIYTVNVKDLAESGVYIYDESGDRISDTTLFIVLPKGKQSATSEHFSKGKIYSSSGKRVISNISFSLKGSKTKYDLLNSSVSGVSLAVSQQVAKNLVLTTKVPFNKRGLVWLDDNNEPLC